MKAVRKWLQLYALLLWTVSAARRRTAAFFRELESLCAVDRLDTVLLTIWWTRLGGQHEKVVLSLSPDQLFGERAA